MPISIVVGGQYGSEGKGKVAHFIARTRGATAAVRVGGPNSGHTIYDTYGHSLILQQLPTAAILPDVVCVLGAGTYIDVARLKLEMELTGVSKERLKVDPQAVVIRESHRTSERSGELRALIGSTETGTGAAVIERISRNSGVQFAENDIFLAPYIADTKSYLRGQLDRSARLVIEGTQGFGLSVLHGPHYPYATSRDTTAAAFLSEVGLSPFDVDDVSMVIRTFPIRVGGHSGPLDKECTWADVARESRSQEPIIEYTSVTKSVRRVGWFSPELVLKAIQANRPTSIFLNHVDYFDSNCRTAGRATARALSKVGQIENMLGVKITHLGIDEKTTLDLSRCLLASAA